MTKEEKLKLIQELYNCMDREGVMYYFTSYGPDIESLGKLGFNTTQIKESIEAAGFLESIYSDLESMWNEIEEEGEQTND